MSRIKIGLVVDGLRADRYVEELVRWAKAQPSIRFSLILQPRRTPPGALAVLLRAERMLLRRNRAHRDHYALRDLSGIAGNIVDAESARALDLDLLILGTPDAPCHELLGASRLGVIAFLHQDHGFAGFWECYRREPCTEFRIRKLGAAREEVLARGAFKTLFYYSLNQAHVYKKTVSHLKHLLEGVAASGRLPAAQPGVRSRPAPGAAHLLAYRGKLLGRVALKALARLPFLRERFGVALVPGTWDQPVREVRARTPPGSFWADPFLHTRGGRTYCFAEEIDRGANRGRIGVLEVVGGRLVERGTALEEPFHLSFPFLFEYRGELYMCPESAEAREIRVYRCIGFPLKWRLEKTLMRGVSAADTVLFERGGRWWMLTSIDEADTGDHCSELYLFSADSPLSATWTPHRQNPILIDSLGGRNGGLVREGESLFRLGQCQGFDRYGDGLRIYEIREVSEVRYREGLVREIGSDPSCGISRTHHLSTDGRTTVVDYVRGL